MLKFLRKYNVLILVVGGSLLMVVFLLQPVLTQIAPNPAKRKVATIGPDNRKVSEGDIREAANDLRILDSISPIISPLVLQLEPSDDSTHYYLLLHEADNLGVVGGVDDGPAWFPELAALVAQIEIRRQFQAQGIPQQFWPQLISPQQIAQLTAQAETDLAARRDAAAGRFGVPIERVDQALANARGILRLKADLYRRALRLSTPDAIELAHDRYDAALADILVVPSSTLADEIPEPTEEQLQAHFDEFKAELPGSGDLGFGYLMPPSVKLEYLHLAPSAFSAAARPDAVEVRKRWERDRTTYPGEFADERARIEAELRALDAERLMIEADEIIRREVLAKTRPLETDRAGYLVLPDDWESRRPRMADIAQTIVDELADREGVTVPRPTVEIRAADWLTTEDLAAPPLSRAAYRIGATGFRLAGLPLVVRENQTGEEAPLTVQVGAPIVETPATDASGNRFYVTILAARPESPPDSLDDVRDQIRDHVTDKLAYERLIAEAPRYERLARDEGLAAVAALLTPAAEDADEDTAPTPPVVDEGVLLTRSRVTPQATATLNNRVVAQATEFLAAAVDAAAERLDPLAPIGASPADESIVWAASPRLRVVTLGRLTAYRPVTVETFRAAARAMVASESAALLLSADPDAPDPFAFDAMTTRTNYIPTDDRDDEDDDVADAAPDAQPAEG